MTILTEGTRGYAFLVSVANGQRSFKEVVVTVPANSTIVPGTSMGKITTGGKFIAQLAAASDGSEDPAGLLLVPQTNTTGSAIDVLATVVIRDAEVVKTEITYDPAANAAAILAADVALAALGIIVR
jgi:hypothetical protein